MSSLLNILLAGGLVGSLVYLAQLLKADNLWSSSATTELMANPISKVDSSHTTDLVLSNTTPLNTQAQMVVGMLQQEELKAAYVMNHAPETGIPTAYERNNFDPVLRDA